jgi:hypothetical protein
VAQKKRGASPGGSGTPQKFIASGKSDGSDTSLEILVSQLVPRPVRPDEIPELRASFWSQAALGHRLPAERGVILLDAETGITTKQTEALDVEPHSDF